MGQDLIAAPCSFRHQWKSSELRISKEKLGSYVFYQVICSCGAKGSNATSEKQAVEVWNERD